MAGCHTARMHSTERIRIAGAALVAFVLMTGCGGSTSDTVSQTTSTSLTPTTTTSTTTPATTTPTTSTPTTSTAPTTTTTSTSTTVAPAPSLTIPVPDGIAYRPGGEDLEASGPGLFAVTDDGVAHIVEPVDRRLVRASADGMEYVDLIELDILGVTAIAADRLDLILIEVFFGPVRQRVHRLDSTGAVVSSVDLPEGFQLEDGLSGVLTDDDGDVVIEFGGGGTYGRYDAETGSFARERSTTVRGVSITPAAPDLIVDGVRLTADLVGEFGALRYLATDSSGVHAIERVDVVATSPLRALRTVEWYAPDGTFLGSALVPSIDEQAVDVAPGLAVMPSGDVIVLLALEDAVVVRPLERQATRIVD